MTDTVHDERRRDYFTTDNWIFGYLPFIGRPAFVVYSLLLSMAGQSRKCWPGLSYIQKHADCSRNSVLEAIALLEEYGLIRVDRHKTPGKLDYNEYHILTAPKVPKSNKPTPTGSNGELVQHTEPVHSVTQTGSVANTQPVQSVNPNKTQNQQYTKRTRQQQAAAQAKPSANVVVAPPVYVSPMPAEPEPITDYGQILLAKLIQIGITPAAAENLVRTGTAAQIRAVLESDGLKQAKNPAGFARTMIEKGYTVKSPQASAAPERRIEHRNEKPPQIVKAAPYEGLATAKRALRGGKSDSL